MSTGLIVAVITASLSAAGTLRLIGKRKAADVALAVAFAGLMFGVYGRREVLDQWTKQEFEKAQAELQPLVEGLLPTTTTTIPK